MNKKGFTLIEVISVIALLGLLMGIAVPNIMKASNRTRQRTLSSKVKNMEKAAALYAQDIDGGEIDGHSIIPTLVDSCSSESYCCEKNASGSLGEKPNCYTIQIDGDDTITLETLAIAEYIKYDEGTNIENPVTKESMNNCEIRIYQKYGKFYALYDKTVNTNKCWFN